MTLLARPPSQPRLLTVVKQDGIVTEKMYRVASSAKLTHLAALPEHVQESAEQFSAG